MSNSERTLKRICAVNDISCFGKCSLTVSIPLLSRFGAEAVPLPTAILSTHTGGFSGFTCLDMTDEMQKIIAHWREIDLELDCVYTGYLLGERQIDIALDFVNGYKNKGAYIAVDPVMADNGKLYHGFDKPFVRRMRELCSTADVITPNVTEAYLLADMDYAEIQSVSEIDECARRLAALGAKKTIITGVRPNADEISDMMFDENGNIAYRHTREFVKCRLHGCGDVFTSVFCARVVNGEAPEKCVERAAKFTDACIRETVADIDNHWYGLKFETRMGDLPE